MTTPRLFEPLYRSVFWLAPLLAGVAAQSEQVNIPSRKPGNVLSVSESSACAILSNGTVACWGRNDFGQLGKAPSSGVLAPNKVDGLSKVISVSAGPTFSCAVTTAGNVRCWGRNEGGWIGDGTFLDRFTPTLVKSGGNVLTGIKSVSVGPNHACAVSTAGKAYCWGRNDEGQLGDGSWKRQNQATVVTGLKKALEVAVGDRHTCAMLSSGRIYCWGGNDKDQLGNGTFINSATPVRKAGLSKAIGLAVGSTHSCALRSPGTLTCWGSNGHGEIGLRPDNGTSFLGSVTAVKALTAGRGYTCALKLTGRVFCWGRNVGAMLSTAPYSISLVNPTMQPQKDIAEISGGADALCAAVADGTVRCWGSNANGLISSDYDISSTSLNNPLTISLGLATASARLASRSNADP